MKKLLISLTIILCVSPFVSSFAFGGQVDSVKTIISELVQQQIAEIQNKKAAEEISQSEEAFAKSSFWNSNDFIFLSFLVSFGINVYLYFVLLRRAPKIQPAGPMPVQEQLKKNIALLRKEKIGTTKEDKHGDVRSKLRYSVWQKKMNEDQFPNRAKKLAISQGELMLAAKLNKIRSSIAKQV